ncbi:MAG: tetratricopeptide repeat protein, partial [Candidatus Nealsonbacteria bacterium]|nr:tetratricopeptide repeat protein [Candidatus Nealsonbacteria bacterium]
MILSIIILLIVDFRIAWSLVAVGCALFIVLSMQKRDLIGGNKLVLAMFFLAISLLFIFFNFQFSNFISRPIEVYLNQRASLDIAVNTLKERPIFGSGPGTFSYDFSKFKGNDLNQTLLWNVRFEGAGSKMMNVLTETGVLGFVSYIFFLIVFFFSGLLFFLRGRKQSSEEESEENKLSWIVGAGAFISFISLIVSYCFYNSNMTIDFLLFLLLAVMSIVFYPDKKEIELKTSSIPTLTLTFILMVAFIASLGVLISGAQKYAAEVYYFNALSLQNTGKIDAALANGEKAVAMNQKSDVLARDLAQIYLAKLNTEVNRKDIPASQVGQNAQKLVQLANNSVQRAISLNSFDPLNWSVKGYISLNLIPLYIGFDEEAIKAYDEAIKLEPSNPYYQVQEGIVFLTSASQLKEDQKADKEKKLADAEAKFKKAIELKSDYATALYQLSVVYQMQGKTNEAIAELLKAEAAAPYDVGLIFQLGIVYYGNQKYDLARQEFEKAVNINPQYSNALYFLGLT